ncbi:non-specific lethal 1 [Carabus blaptoides fortunei]
MLNHNIIWESKLNKQSAGKMESYKVGRSSSRNVDDLGVELFAYHIPWKDNCIKVEACNSGSALLTRPVQRGSQLGLHLTMELAASVRHPNAVVMAPALTEAGQSQNFSLPPSSPITSVTQNGGYVSHDDDDVHHTACKTSAVAGGAELKIKYTYRDNGVGDGADDLFHVTPTHYNGGNSALVRKLLTASDKQQVLHVHPSHNTIMNTSPTHMGDDQQQQQQQQHPPDTMGLQKAGMDAAMASLLKDKPTSNDVEQLLNKLTSTDDLGHNVDELMQVIKHMEGGTGSGTGTTSDVPATGDSEPTETIFPDAFDRELFSEVDMIGMCDDETLVEPVVVATTSKEDRASEFLEELHRKQLKLERRSEFLLRRLRKVQARAMGRHVSAEVAGVFELVNRTLRRGARDPTTSTAVSDANNGVPNTQLPGDTSRVTVISEPVVPIGQKTVDRLVQQLHKSAVHEASVARPKHAARYFGSGSLEPSPGGGQRPSAAATASGVISVPPLAVEARDEMERTAGMLQSQLSMVETQLDSDATASSSGAESCDEMQTYNNPHQNFLSIGKRAAWRYANERAAVASRWTWLQAQISDLEYRIRQHNELHRQIRACKGAVTLGEHIISTNASQQQPQSPNAVNGYRGQLPGATKPSLSDDLVNGAVATASSPPSAAGCARIRPLNRSTFRKRKLLQTTGLHTLSKKASRPSNIRCGCVPPVVPCALCTGRTDPTFPRDLPEQLTVPERIALLDPGYHPVLSFPDDISQSIHLEAIMKLPEWQQKTLRANSKSMKGLSKLDRPEKITAGMDNNRPKTKSEHRNKKYNRLLKSGTMNALTNKLKNKVGRGRKPLRMNRKRHNARMAMAQMHSLASESMDEEMEALGGVATATGGDSSLTPSPLSHVVPYRRSRVDSYDIDNIVIPYSVAASTRVEKLQYKEILTPKWRVIDSEFPGRYDVKNNGILRRTSEDSDVEDISDDTIAVRHDKCEHDEKKKFLSYIKFPLTVGRSRANRRTDSRAESSGANTPDPMSPHPGEMFEAASSPLTSPPATPLSMLATNEDTTVQTAALRRRTVSQSRWSEHRCNTPPDTAIELVPPYELRSFPLLEDTCPEIRPVR